MRGDLLVQRRPLKVFENKKRVAPSRRANGLKKIEVFYDCWVLILAQDGCFLNEALASKPRMQPLYRHLGPIGFPFPKIDFPEPPRPKAGQKFIRIYLFVNYRPVLQSLQGIENRVEGLKTLGCINGKTLVNEPSKMGNNTKGDVLVRRALYLRPAPTVQVLELLPVSIFQKRQ